MSLESTSDHLSELNPIKNMVVTKDLSLLKQRRIDRFNKGIYRKDEYIKNYMNGHDNTQEFPILESQQPLKEDNKMDKVGELCVPYS